MAEALARAEAKSDSCRLVFHRAWLLLPLCAAALPRACLGPKVETRRYLDKHILPAWGDPR